MGPPQGIPMQYNNVAVLLQSRMISLPDCLSMRPDYLIFLLQTTHD